MANSKHVEIVKQGMEAIREWRDSNPGARLELSQAELGALDLRRADISQASLREADLGHADLRRANISWADLRGADLSGADLRWANLNAANLAGAKLCDANLSHVSFTGLPMVLGGMGLFTVAYADLTGAEVRGAILHAATIGWTVLADVDLSDVKQLETVRHRGPSTIGIDTLARSQGRIAVEFLRGCGLLPWEVLEARLYNTDLTAREISELQARILDKRAQGPFARVFVSYSHVDAKFAEKLAARLGKAGFPVFIDRADLVAGPMQAQISNAIRCADVVVPVLSKASTTSDWVENEVEMARAKEKRENRCVLCPVALDDSWRAKLEDESSDRQLWRVLTKRCIVDFSKWKTKVFNREFEKLLRGIKIHYEPKHE